MARAQLSVDIPVHDFGVLTRADPTWADFMVLNHTDSPATLFRVDVPRRTEVLFSQKTIPAGDSAVVRIRYLPTEAGSFHVKMQLYASAWNRPETLELKGESTYAASDGIPCPSFEEEPHARLLPVAFSLRGNLDKQPVEGGKIRVFQHGELLQTLYTDRYGEALATMPTGRYFIAVDAEGSGADTTLYLNATNDHLLMYLPTPATAGQPLAEAPDAEFLQNEASSKQTAPTMPAEKPAEAKTGTDISGPTRADEGAAMPRSEFKESNLVFLVDVSSSMKANGKLDLLKIAMTDLLEVLHPDDRFALIEYASETGVLIETHGNLNKEQCRAAIGRLEAGGSTAGAKALDKAGKTALRHFLDGGNNQIVLATDGSFNEGAARAVKLSKKYRDKDVSLSVLGIRCGAFGEKEMRELASAGGGRYVPVDGVDDAGARLISEIKTSARR